MRKHQQRNKRTTEFLPDACPDCGSTKLHSKDEKVQFPYGPDGPDQVILSAVVPVQLCRDCGFASTGTEAEQRRHVAVCQHLGLLCPDEIVKIRNELNMTQEELTEVAGFGRASLIRWENGQLFQNKANDQLIYLLKFQENLKRLKQRSASGQIDGDTVIPIFRFLPPVKSSHMADPPFQLRSEARNQDVAA